MKYQWYNVKWLLSYEDLKASLLGSQYSEDKGNGFILDETLKKGIIRGRYIIKYAEKHEILTPCGDIEYFERPSYVTYQFDIDLSQKLSLMLINPPRSSSKLGIAFSNVTVDKVIFNPVNIDLKELIISIEKKLRDFSLRRIDVNQISFSASTNASLILKGDGQLISLLYKVYHANDGKLIRADFSFRTENGTHRATITHSGALNSKDSFVLEILRPIFFAELEELSE